MKRLGLITSQLASLSLLFASKAHAVQINPTIPPQVVPGGSVGLNDVVSFVIIALVAIGIIAAVIWLIIGAIRWVTSGGDKAKVESARNHIIAAIVGLVIIILSLVIINVVADLFGVSTGFLQFNIQPLR